MTVQDDDKALAQRLYDEVFNAGKIELIDELLAEDAVDHEEIPGVPPNRESLRQFVAMLRAAFRNVRFAPEDLIAEGDRVVARARPTGTQRGEFIGMPATNKSVDIEVIDIVQVVDGKLTKFWGVIDQLLMMQQLGVIPEEPQP